MLYCLIAGVEYLTSDDETLLGILIKMFKSCFSLYCIYVVLQLLLTLLVKLGIFFYFMYVI